MLSNQVIRKCKHYNLGVLKLDLAQNYNNYFRQSEYQNLKLANQITMNCQHWILGITFRVGHTNILINEATKPNKEVLNCLDKLEMWGQTST